LNIIDSKKASVFFIGTSTDRKDDRCIERLAGLYQSAGRKTSHALEIQRALRLLHRPAWHAVGIDHRGPDIGVAEKRLDRADS
jgi:hypothetical protein